ncbi:MAG: hypothetical protein H6730_35480 [Deltaproteobacteria bacterium]|nr:hypothetical protein [Deltaproteobacteria bacterium]
MNQAQAHRWNGDKKRCSEIMAAEDWSATSEEFRLADAVLSEDWEKAAAIIRKAGAKGRVGEAEFRDWPLFRELREQPQFLDAYKEAFDTDFAAAFEEEETGDEIDGLEGSATEGAAEDEPQIDGPELEPTLSTEEVCREGSKP